MGNGKIHADGIYRTPPEDGDWAILPHVTSEPQRARDIAAAITGASVEEVMNNGQSVEVSRQLKRLNSSGYVEPDYYHGGTVLAYVITDKGQEKLKEKEFLRLLAQAA